MFGTQTTAGGFGAAAPFGASGTNTFGASTSAGGGLFGAKQPSAFGAPASTSGFNFQTPQNTATSSAAGSLFGQPKPFGTVAPQQAGGLFGSTTPAFGQTSTAPTFGVAGQPAFGQQQGQNQAINLFGQQQKPTGFGAPFGQTATSIAAPAFGGGFGQTAGTIDITVFRK